MTFKLLLLIALLPLLAIGVYRLRKIKWLSNLLLSLFSVLLVILLAEFIYRLFWNRKQIVSTVNNYYKADSLIGYRFDPGIMKAVEYLKGGDTIYNTTYTILADTNRFGADYPMRKAFLADSLSKEIVFFGCSFTFGEGLADQHTLPFQLGKRMNRSTVNRACNGLGVHQVYQLFRSEYAKQENRNRVFIYPLFYEHFFRARGMYSWNMLGPYFEIESDSLVNRGPAFKVKAGRKNKIVHYASFLGTLTVIKDNLEKIIVKDHKRRLSESDLEPYYRMLKEMSVIAQQTGSKLVLLDWDEENVETGSKTMDSDLKNKELMSMAGLIGAEYFRVSDIINKTDPKFFIPGDGHPSALANEAIAEFLAGKLQ